MRSELAPTARLRVGINTGNFLLVTNYVPGAEPRGVAPDLGRELGRRLGVPIEFVVFDSAGKLADAGKTGVWDVAFLGNEPQRANEISCTAAYLEIPVNYLVLVLDGQCTSVKQSIGTPHGRYAGAKYLREFVEEVKASGLVARSIAQYGVRGVSVASPTPLDY